MASLASFLTPLSPVLGVSIAALYERQRALVRAGVLPKATGRGRSSGGARATPETVAWILLTLLSTDNLSEVAHETPKVAKLVIGKKSQRGSPFVENSTLLDALTLAITDISIAERITAMKVFRKISGAIINLSNEKVEDLQFGNSKVRALSFIGMYDGEKDRAPAIHVQAELAGYDILQIASALAQEEWQ